MLGYKLTEFLTVLPTQCIRRKTKMEKVIGIGTEIGIESFQTLQLKLYEADTVVYATGRRPLQAEAEALRFCAPEFHQIGDCWIARNVQHATRMAQAVARDL